MDKAKVKYIKLPNGVVIKEFHRDAYTVVRKIAAANETIPEPSSINEELPNNYGITEVKASSRGRHRKDTE